MRRYFATLPASLAVAIVLSAPALAQETQQPGGVERPGAAPIAAEVHLNLVDQKLALSIAVDTLAQIELGEFALNSTANEALRKMLSGRIEEHRAVAARLESLTGGKSKTAIARALREIEEDRLASAARPKKFSLTSASQQATAMVVRIRVEHLQEFARLLRRELEAKQAAEFDRHFLRMDVLNQMQMQALLKVFEGQASSDFAAVIHEVLEGGQSHLDRSRQLLLQLEAVPLTAGAPLDPPLVETAVKP